MSVKERLPDTKLPILILHSNAVNIATCFTGTNSAMWYVDGVRVNDPTHWRELPSREGQNG